MKPTLLTFFFSLFSLFLLTAQNPGAYWMQYPVPEQAGWSTEKLAAAKSFSDSIGTAAFMLIYDGKIV